MLMRLLWVCAGGALGSGARFLAGLAVSGETSTHYGTWFVNILGSFALGYAAIQFAGASPQHWHFAITTGLLGGFTTYSTFSLDTYRFLARGEYGLAGLNVGLTLLVCLGATFAGAALAGRE